MKQFEPVLSGEDILVFESTQPNVDPFYCSVSDKRFTWRGCAIRCHFCMQWFYWICANLAITECKEYKRTKKPWFCGCTPSSVSSPEINFPNSEIFGRYVDDIIRTSKRGEIEENLRPASTLHPCIEFTIELKCDEELHFLDTFLLRDQSRIETAWYTNSTDTGSFMYFRACASTNFKRKIFEDTVHRLHYSTYS